jgi:cytochrome c-type protein NapC
MLKRWMQNLLTPSPSRSVLFISTIGVVIGVIGVIAFDTTMHATNTEEFCTSCHEMEANPYAQLQKTSHFSNAMGVSAQCSDCHVPHEFVPKMIRKIEASREVWGKMMGIINTPEKYAAHAPKMKAREIARLRANDSQECRNCHQVERMLMAQQSSKAQEYHRAMKSNGKTCIDCHTGIAHPENTAGRDTNVD